MSDSCYSPPARSADPRYQRILWIALVLNITMFGVEIAGSVQRSEPSSGAMEHIGARHR
jgi:Co/Zn/Cd efflux system component